MTPIGHIAVGFAAKRVGRKIHLGVLLAAAWLLDMLFMIFALLGIESAENFSHPGAAPGPWSHGLLMAVIWSLLAGLAAAKVYRSRPAGLIFGLVVFSHWVLDFIFWDNLYLVAEGSPQMGLGLFKALGANSTFIELGLLLVGLAVYWHGRKPRPHLALN